MLLLGETGTGKELIARSIHKNSDRSQGPFVALNLAAVPKELALSELFGYDEGAFSGSIRGGKPGKIELANSGTLFLDELADMPVEVQVALLRFLEERQDNTLRSDSSNHRGRACDCGNEPENSLEPWPQESFARIFSTA